MSEKVTGAVLAGGLARRLGHVDKALIELDGRPLLAHVLDRFESQCATTIINANGNAERFSSFGLPVVADTIDEFPGPLAGVLAAMEWSKANRPDHKWVATIAVDVPFLPLDLVARMMDEIDNNKADLACAKSNDRAHPVIGLWPVSLAENLRAAMVDEDMRKVDLWTARFSLVETQFGVEPVDPFFNINRREDMEKAEQILKNLEVIK